MRSDHEWLRLLERQAADLDACSDYLYACREAGTGVDEARGAFSQALQLYRGTLEVCPLHLVLQFAGSRRLR